MHKREAESFRQDCKPLFTVSIQLRDEAVAVCMAQTTFIALMWPIDASDQAFEKSFHLLRPGVRHLQLSATHFTTAKMNKISEKCQLDESKLDNLTISTVYLDGLGRPWLQWALTDAQSYAHNVHIRLNALDGRHLSTACKIKIGTDQSLELIGLRKQDVDEAGEILVEELLALDAGRPRTINMVHLWPPRQPSRSIDVSRHMS